MREEGCMGETCAPVLASRNAMVSIEKVENGFIVRIGCKTFVSTTWAEINTALSLYWEKPEEAQNQYCK